MKTGIYVLHSRNTPAGDQPEAIARLIANVEAGATHQTLKGITGSGKTFTMANVIHRLNRPTLILAPNKTLTAQLYDEMRHFFPENAVEYFVSYYDYFQPEIYLPGSDRFIPKDSAINDQLERLRLSTIGIMQYIAPTMIFLIAIFIFKEPFDMVRMAAFAMIWVALAIYTGSSLLRLKR